MRRSPIVILALLPLAACGAGRPPPTPPPQPQVYAPGSGCEHAQDQLQRSETFFAAEPGTVGNVYAGGMPFIPPRGPIGGVLLLGALAAQAAATPPAGDYTGRRRADTRDDQPSLLRSIGGDLVLEAEILAITQSAAEILRACPDVTAAVPVARRIAARATARGALLDQGVALLSPGEPMRLMPGSEVRALAVAVDRRRTETLATLASLEAVTPPAAATPDPTPPAAGAAVGTGAPR